MAGFCSVRPLIGLIISQSSVGQSHAVWTKPHFMMMMMMNLVLFSSTLLFSFGATTKPECFFEKAPEFTKTHAFWSGCSHGPLSVSNSIPHVVNGVLYKKSLAEYLLSVGSAACFSTSDLTDKDGSMIATGYKIELMRVDHQFQVARHSKRLANHILQDVHQSFFECPDFAELRPNLQRLRGETFRQYRGTFTTNDATEYSSCDADLQAIYGSDYVHLAEIMTTYDEYHTFKISFLLPDGTVVEKMLERMKSNTNNVTPLRFGPSNVSIGMTENAMSRNPFKGKTLPVFQNNRVWDQPNEDINSVDGRDSTKAFWVHYDLPDHERQLYIEYDVNDFLLDRNRASQSRVQTNEVSKESNFWKEGLYAEEAGTNSMRLVGGQYLGGAVRISLESLIDIKRIYKESGIASNFTCTVDGPLSRAIICTVSNVVHPGQQTFSLYKNGTCETQASTTILVFDGVNFRLPIKRGGDYHVCSIYGVCYDIFNVTRPVFDGPSHLDEGDKNWVPPPPPPPLPPPPHEDPVEEDTGLGVVTVIIIVVASVLGLVALIAIGMIIRRRRAATKTNQ